MSATRKHSTRAVILLVAAGVLLLGAATWMVVGILAGIGERNPFAGAELYVYPDSAAAVALKQSSSDDLEAIARISETPAAIWILPEAQPIDTVGDFVDRAATDAEAQGELPVFVVYGIPDRDCQSESAGGLDAETYPEWVSAIGAGLVNHDSIIVLEPDSLSLATECGNVDERVAQIQDASARLMTANVMFSAPGPSIYLDGAHSDWMPVEAMADILNRAGVAGVQGFATNVSNFNATADEVAYAEEVSSLTGGAHYVIDTSRNGNGSNGQWCNPSGRVLGDSPSVVSGSSTHDANLWVKNPGESDGQCNGGPAAGQWWLDGALALARN